MLCNTVSWKGRFCKGNIWEQKLVRMDTQISQTLNHWPVLWIKQASQFIGDKQPNVNLTHLESRFLCCEKMLLSPSFALGAGVKRLLSNETQLITNRMVHASYCRILLASLTTQKWTCMKEWEEQNNLCTLLLDRHAVICNTASSSLSWLPSTALWVSLF